MWKRHIETDNTSKRRGRNNSVMVKRKMEKWGKKIDWEKLEKKYIKSGRTDLVQ